MNWFRTHRRRVAAAVVLALLALALLRYACPWPLDTAAAMAQAAHTTASANPSDFCGPDGCTLARADSPVSDPSLPASPLAPLLAAILFFAVSAFTVAGVATRRAQTFAGLPGFPAILEFYRLRI